MWYTLLALLLLFSGLLALWLASRRQRAAGLPLGRVIYDDAGRWGKPEKPFYDAALSLTGKPDYLVEQNGKQIPVEVKSSWAPAQPYDSHLYQLAAYCLLVERAYTRRPPYGILRYRNRAFAIDYTPQLETHLLDLLAEIRQQQRRPAPDRSHQEPTRCSRCGYRSACDQRL